jgi:ectoine hydroxylase-related dioxygenase (phytanoyl-CoA dioxygenase family)
MHMGGLVDSRNQYSFVGRTMVDDATCSSRARDFNLLSVRILYALHDIPVEHGPLCVVPRSHKANYFSPYDAREPTDEPGMIPVPMEAGDAILFTENLRRGGFPNLTDAPCKTLHLLISPAWVASQSPIHWGEQVHVSPEAWSRYSAKQRAILPAPAAADELEVKRIARRD